MKKINILILTMFLALWVQPVMAYIDPGSGSAIMTAIISFFVAIGLAVKTYWYKIKSFFTGGGKQQKTDLDSTSEDQ